MIISESELFRDLGYETLQEIAEICTEEFFFKDSVIFKQDQPANTLYILTQGTVKLVVSNGGHITFTLTEQGEVFGWSSMFIHATYTASSICASDVKVIKLQQHELDHIFYRHPLDGIKVLKRLGNVVAKRLSYAYQSLLSSREGEKGPSYG